MFSSEIVIADGLTSERILSLDFVESHHCVIDTSSRACSPVWGHRLNCTIVQSHNTDLSTVCDNTARGWASSLLLQVRSHGTVSGVI